MIRVSSLIALVVSVTGCVSVFDPIPIEYEFLDDIPGHRVELRYLNNLEFATCLLPGSWPNLGGKINDASTRVFLVVGDERLPIRDWNTGYCGQPDGCATHVAPGDRVLAFISYSDFGLPERLYEQPKSLEFSPVAYKCR